MSAAIAIAANVRPDIMQLGSADDGVVVVVVVVGGSGLQKMLLSTAMAVVKARGKVILTGSSSHESSFG